MIITHTSVHIHMSMYLLTLLKTEARIIRTILLYSIKFLFKNKIILTEVQIDQNQ